MSIQLNNNSPQTTIRKATRFKDKQKIMKNAKYLKETSIFIYEDFCKDTMGLRENFWNQELKYHKQTKLAYLKYRSIVVRERGRDTTVR